MKRLISGLGLLIIGIGLVGCGLFTPAATSGDISGGDSLSPQAALSPTAQGNADLIPPQEWWNYPLPQADQPAAVVRVEPQTMQLNLGDVATFQIMIDSATDLVGAEIAVQFNPAVLQVQDADTGQDGVQIQPGSFPPPQYVARNVVSNTVGIINYTVSELAPFQPVSGSGLLTTISFQAVGQGSTEIGISQAILVNNQIQAIPVTTQPAQVIVGQGPTSTPTLTPLPGQATATFTPIPIPSSTVIVTATPIAATVTAIATETPSATPSPTFTPTPLPTPTATNTPVAPSVYIPPDATVGFCYRVQPGETLYNLGQKCAVDNRFCGLPDPQFISIANDLHPPDYVYPQQILFIPRQYGSGPNVYIVQAGDTLAQIEQNCKLESGIVAQVNGLPADANVQVGTALIIPRPPYPPPSRYPYAPGHVWPPPCPAPCKK